VCSTGLPVGHILSHVGARTLARNRTPNTVRFKSMIPISTTITSGGHCLVKPIRGPRGSWWLRHASGTFHLLRRRCPGHQPFREQVRLPEGQYVLGVGELRFVVDVTPVGTSTRSVPR